MLIPIRLAPQHQYTLDRTLLSLLALVIVMGVTAPVMALPAPGGAAVNEKTAYSATPT
ncbi:MAG: hypothetical protein QNL91_02720 [Candidatus Krumholzibacteria bacterium]|nr:hypothetical protein [Candidatus Krumholzibacteria bacterium]